MLQLATAVECPHQLKPSNRHISCPGSRAGAPVCQRANPAVAVVRYSWCRALGFIRAAVGCVCAVGLTCAVCVLAMWLQVWLQDDHDTSRRTRVIPVVDRSDSPLYIIAFGAVEVFIILIVLGLHANPTQALFARPYYAKNFCRRSYEECV